MSPFFWHRNFHIKQDRVLLTAHYVMLAWTAAWPHPSNRKLDCHGRVKGDEVYNPLHRDFVQGR